MIHIIWFIIIGAVVGGVAELLVPGRQDLGFWKSALLGIVGAVIGGLVARLFSRPAPGSSFHPAGILLSLICAIVLLVIWLKFIAAPA
jgi:uncharacterized membrane protein YeaQ/YmgE (transglycosylase-associated protein family)